MFNWGRNLTEEDYKHEESDYQYNKLKDYNKEIDFTKDYKEGILKRNDNFKAIKASYKLDCLYLFYGSQNGWKEYQTELIKNLKLNNQCYNDLNNHFKFVEEKLKDKNKNNLIQFLESLNNEK